MVKHRLPDITEMYFELRNVTYFSETIPSQENFNFEQGVTFIPDKETQKLSFIIHIQWFLKDENGDEEISAMHVDYDASIKIEEMDWDENTPLRFNANFLSHLFGMCILMIRGRIKQRLSGSPIGHLEMPPLNPREMLDRTLYLEDEDYLIDAEEE